MSIPVLTSAYTVEGNTITACNGEIASFDIYPQTLDTPKKQEVTLKIPNFPPDQTFRFVEPGTYPTTFTWQAGDTSPRKGKISVTSDNDGENESMEILVEGINGTIVAPGYEKITIVSKGDTKNPGETNKCAEAAHPPRCSAYVDPSSAADMADITKQGYGPPFDVLHRNEQTLSIGCEANKAVAYIESDKVRVYHKGLLYENNQWKEISFNGSSIANNPGWLRFDATAELPASSDGKTRFVAAFLCQFHAGRWKCGCQDQSCTQNFWTVQAYPKK